MIVREISFCGYLIDNRAIPRGWVILPQEMDAIRICPRWAYWLVVYFERVTRMLRRAIVRFGWKQGIISRKRVFYIGGSWRDFLSEIRK